MSAALPGMRAVHRVSRAQEPRAGTCGPNSDGSNGPERQDHALAGRARVGSVRKHGVRHAHRPP